MFCLTLNKTEKKSAENQQSTSIKSCLSTKQQMATLQRGTFILPIFENLEIKIGKITQYRIIDLYWSRCSNIFK
jgi:hypothetical protein